MQFTQETLSSMLGISIPEDICILSNVSKLTYRLPTREDRDKEILNQLKRIESDKIKVGTPERTPVWEAGWSENLQELKRTHSLDALMPRYFRKGQPFRLFQDFIYSDNYKLDFELGKIIKRAYFNHYFEDFNTIYEFGCGTGFNLVELSRLFPDKLLFGCDLTIASTDILSILNSEFNIPVQGRQFDFIAPDYSFHLEKNSAVYTAAALEQIGEQYEAFLEYLLSEKPALVLHLEPLEELYDENNLIDYLAKRFHENRHYLKGYYTRLKQLESEQKVEIMAARRTYFGNFNDESYSLLVWRPL